MAINSFFGSDKTDRPQAGTVAVEARWTSQLLNALRANRKVQNTPNTLKWFKELEQLRSITNDKDIQTVLDWYCNNLKDPAIPKAFAARSFREKFFEIKDAMGNTIPTKSDPAVEEILKRLSAKTWPKNSAKQLPNIVARSYDYYRKFSIRLKDLQVEMERGDSKKKRIGRTIEDLRWVCHGNASSFVLHWFQDASDLVRTFKVWSGRLDKFVIGPAEDLKFYEFCRFRVEAYCGENKVWEQILEMINAG